MKNQKTQKIIILLVLFLLGGNGVVLGENQLSSADLGEPGFSLSYLETFGVTGEPYVFTNDHINHPMGLFVDLTGALYVAEQNGSRVMKFDAAGDFTMEFGEVGQPWHHDHYLYRPSGVTVSDDGHVWVMMSNAIKEYDENGEILQSYPDENQWESGSGDDRFDIPYQAIFNNAGTQLFVSDQYNNRIQVFDVAPADNALAYAETITGGFDQPHGLAFDSTGDLYVVDYGNHQVQRCVNDGTNWSCSNFLGTAGTSGDGLDELYYPVGLYINSGDDFFIADSGNNRILKCEDPVDPTGCVLFAGGTSGSGNDQLTFLAGITGDDSGNIFVSDKDNHRVQVFDQNGDYLSTYGITKEPYLVDNERLNQPVGIAATPDGGMLITEGAGHRLIKLNASGDQVWTVGEAGIYGNDNDHFGAFWGGFAGSPAVDGDGNIYVPDTGNDRIQVFNGDGSFNRTFGGWGDGNNQFWYPSYITINPANGDILITDTSNHRVQVYNHSLIYKATIGITGEPGSDDQHLDYPQGVAVGANGAVYIGDFNNRRVQKCTLNGSDYSCQTFVGNNDEYIGAFDQVIPRGVTVDEEGRVYVSDDGNSRVLVFDSTGAFLTSVGGSWGSKTSEFYNPYGIAIDANGDILVADLLNCNIKKFTIGVPDWSQANINGFGVPTITFFGSLVEFSGQLYASTGDWEKGGQIFRSMDGNHWTPVSEPGFGEAANSVIISMIVFKGQLYASTGWGGGIGQVWRSSDGENWTKVVPDGFGNVNNESIIRLVIYNDALYAATGNWVDGAEVWRSSTGNSGSWTRVVSGGFNNSNNYKFNSFVINDGFLYAAGENTIDGAEIWRTNDGANWQKANANGFGNAANQHIGSIIQFNNMLYASTRNDETGAEIFRSADGTTWTKVIDSGITQPANYKIESLFVYKGEMYVIANNLETGLKVWRSDDGVTFTQLIDDGFGDSNNESTLWNSATFEYKNQLYIGTTNGGNGSELWRFGTGYNLFLPLLVK